jgi:glycosyltransferase involved in cell wall biosynthesis
MAALHSLSGTWSDCVDNYICLTEHQKAKMIEGGLPAEKLIVKGNSVYPDPGVGPGTGGFCLFVGRLSPEKGVETLLSVWKSCDPSWMLKIVGEGPLAGAVQAAANGQANIEWVGGKSTADVLELMGQAKLLIFPSEWYEAFGRVAIESFAKGTPVLASRIGGICDVVPDGGAGSLFSAGSIEDLLFKLQLMLTDPELGEGMRQEVRREYERRFSGPTGLSELVKIYTEVIS